MTKRRGAAAHRRAGLALAVLLLVLVAFGAGGVAQAERVQEGDLILSADGELTPLLLPRHHTAPVNVRLAAALETADGTLLPRVQRIEVNLAGKGAISTVGLPRCSLRELRYRTFGDALRKCRPALVGHGRLTGVIALPNNAPFPVDTRMLAFNGRVHGSRAVLILATAADPPTSIVLPFILRRRPGGHGFALVSNLDAFVGPWPRFARFDLTLGREYNFRGRSRSYLNASCPIPRVLTAGFFSFAKETFVLDDGRAVTAAITRGCRASRE